MDDELDIVVPSTTNTSVSIAQLTRNTMQPGDLFFSRIMRIGADPRDTSNTNSDVFGLHLVYQCTNV